LQFASRHDGVMHACGHDAHTAMVVAAALALQRRRNSLAGEVRCIFQHAEECEPTGAREVIAAGVLDGVSAIVGLHVEPELPVGMMGGLQAGPRNAASDQFTLTVHGSEAHGARPEQGIDAIVVAAHIVQALQSIPSRLTAAQEPVVLTIGSIQGGTAPNILAGRVTMYGIIRTMNDATRGRVIAMLSRIAEGTAALYAARAEVVVIHGEPAICNDAAVTEVVRDAVRCVLGESAVTPQPPASMGADDFAYYLEHVPGMMFRLGVAEPDRAAYPLHHPRFAIAENALPLGAAVLAAAAVKLTQGGQG
jgi:amidohydrolase